MAGFNIDVNVGSRDIYWIKESHPDWQSLAPLLKEWKVNDILYPEFTKTELENASYLSMNANLHTGYPMPEDDFDYIKVIYGVKNEEGPLKIGLEQKFPFHMRGEPPWGTRQLIQMHWEYGFFFTKPEIWESVFRPFGIEIFPVIKHSTGKYLTTVVQLKSQGQSPAKLMLDGCPYEDTPQGIKNYRLQGLYAKGFIPAFEFDPGLHYFTTQEYYGSGGAANHIVVVSQELFQAIQKNKLKGVNFLPLLNPPCHAS